MVSPPRRCPWAGSGGLRVGPALTSFGSRGWRRGIWLVCSRASMLRELVAGSVGLSAMRVVPWQGAGASGTARLPPGVTAGIDRLMCLACVAPLEAEWDLDETRESSSATTAARVILPVQDVARESVEWARAASDLRLLRGGRLRLPAGSGPVRARVAACPAAGCAPQKSGPSGAAAS